MNEDLEKFCRTYEARIVKSNITFYRRPTMSLMSLSDKYLDESSDFNFEKISHSEVPMISINLPEDRLRSLIEHEKRITDWITPDKSHFHTKYEHILNIVEEHKQECLLRESNPAVKLAWENYQMILRLAR